MSQPAISLVAFTESARSALGGKTRVRITQLPFKVGRESRAPGALRTLTTAVERRLGSVPQLNDLYLIEPPSPEGFQISREHFAIERAGAGFVLVDRQSACGTIVGGKMLGHGGGTVRNVGSERAGGRTELLDGSLIIVGSSTSPYVFRFVVQV